MDSHKLPLTVQCLQFLLHQKPQRVNDQESGTRGSGFRTYLIAIQVFGILHERILLYVSRIEKVRRAGSINLSERAPGVFLHAQLNLKFLRNEIMMSATYLHQPLRLP